MRKYFLVFLFTTFFCSHSQSQLLNSSFENWNGGLPDNWWGVVLAPYNIFSQSTTAHTGQYAVNLHIDTLGGNPFGSVLSTGNGMGVTTHPLSFVPQVVSFWYRLNAQGGDQLSVTALVYSGGTGAGIISTTFPATANYTQVNASFMYGAGSPAFADSIALIFMIVNTVGQATFGSDLLIDDVQVSIGGSIADHNTSDVFSVYPNPASDFVTFQSSTGKPFTELYITDINGKIIYKINLQENYVQIPAIQFPDGIYIAALKVDGALQRRVFIVSR
jgi:hypothetical protein